MGAAVTKKLRGHRGGGNRSLVSGPEELRRSPASHPPAAAHWRRRLFIPHGLVRPSCQDSAAARLQRSEVHWREWVVGAVKLREKLKWLEKDREDGRPVGEWAFVGPCQD